MQIARGREQRQALRRLETAFKCSKKEAIFATPEGGRALDRADWRASLTGSQGVLSQQPMGQSVGARNGGHRGWRYEGAVTMTQHVKAKQPPKAAFNPFFYLKNQPRSLARNQRRTRRSASGPACANCPGSGAAAGARAARNGIQMLQNEVILHQRETVKSEDHLWRLPIVMQARSYRRPLNVQPTSPPSNTSATSSHVISTSRHVIDRPIW